MDFMWESQKTVSETAKMKNVDLTLILLNWIFLKNTYLDFSRSGLILKARTWAICEANGHLAFFRIEGARPLNVSKFRFSKLALKLNKWPLVIGKEGWNIGVFSKVVARTMGIPEPLRSPPRFVRSGAMGEWIWKFEILEISPKTENCNVWTPVTPRGVDFKRSEYHYAP